MTTPTTDAELVKIREAVANDMADAVVPGLLARLDAAEARVREFQDDFAAADGTASYLMRENEQLRKGYAMKADEHEHYQAEAVAQARRDALREAADEARRRADAAAKIHSGTPTDGWLHDFANWIESRMAEYQEHKRLMSAATERIAELEAERDEAVELLRETRDKHDTEAWIRAEAFLARYPEKKPQGKGEG